ncbi:MAG: PIG-L family deacetylase [Planctomycetes bacterium]|nr:PIG-L family deacetylase [Planctomycetota bacterium]
MTTGPRLSIVAIGAHLDDHWYGMGGTLLKAARKGYQVTVIQAVSTYCAWPVVCGREAEIKPQLQRISAEAGIALVTLGHDYLRLENGQALSGQLAQHLADAKPDLVFCPWEEDSNQDHAALGIASRVAAMHGACFLPPDRAYKPPRQILQYALDINARTFRPEAFVDIGGVMFDFLTLNNAFDEMYSTSPGWPDALRRLTVIDHRQGDRSILVHAQSEFILGRSIVRGVQCGARYAEGFARYKSAPADVDLLAQI